MSLRKKTLINLGWSSAENIITQAISILITLVLVRILAPRDFGLMAMIIVFSSYAQQIVKFGFGDVIIQDNTLGETEISSIFWLNVLLGGVLCISFIMLSKPITIFYGEPELYPLILAMSVIFIFKSLSIVQDSLFRKALNFRVLAIRNILAMCIAGLIALILAYKNFGVWALVVQQIVLSFATTVLIWLKSSWRPQFVLNFSSIKKILPFGSSVFFESTLYHISKSIDKVLIGKYIGSSQLGFYSKTFSVLSTITNLSLVMRSVLFPSFSRIKNDPDKTSSFYLLINQAVVFLIIPFIIFLTISANPFVLTVFGPNWISVVPLVRLFSLSILFVTINNLFDPILRSQGNGPLLVKDSFYKKGISVLCIILGLPYGLIGVAFGKLIGDALSVLVTVKHASITVNIKAMEFLSPLFTFVIIGLVTGGCVFFYQTTQSFYNNPFIVLIVNLSSCLLIYFLLSYLFKLSILDKIIAGLLDIKKSLV